MERAPDAVSRFGARRPLCLAAACYALGAAAGCAGHVPAAHFGALAALGGMLFACTRRKVLLFGMLLFTGAWAVASLSFLPPGPVARDAQLTGRVCAQGIETDKGATVTLDRVTLNGARRPGRMRLSLYEQVPLQTGDLIALTADTWLPGGVRNPGGFDFAAWLMRANVRLCATGDARTLRVTGNQLTPQLLLEKLRDAIASRLDALFSANAPLARAILLGDKPAYEDPLRVSFRQAGVAHLMAVSGLHVTCLALALGALLRAIGLSRKRAYWLTLPLMLGYVGVVGMSASAIRATVMYAMLEGARLFGRPPDTLTSLSAALLLLLCANPLMIADPALILSFSAVAGIVLFSPTLTRLLKVNRRGRVARWVLGALSVSLSAQLGTLPAACCLFGTLTPYALLTNLVAVPVCTLALPLIAAAAALSFIAPALGAALAVLPDLLLTLLTRLTLLVARLPWAEVYVPAWPVWLILLYALAGFLASPYFRLAPRVRYACLLGLPVLLATASLIAALSLPGGLSIAFLDAGQADAIVIRAEGRVYMMDVGTQSGPVPGYLAHTGQGVDGVFLTHPHSDHAGGLQALLMARHVPALYLPVGWDAVEADPGVREAVAEAARAGTRLVYLRAGDQVQLSKNVCLTVLGPAADDGAGSGTGAGGGGGAGDAARAGATANAISLVTRISYGAGAALLTGDLTSGAEPVRLASAQLLKAAHHGAAGSTSEIMARAVAPSVAVISVGRNSYGHPAPALLDRLARVGAQVYRTDQMGMIRARIYADGAIEMETFL
ncbi:MAG: ComEC/Rec2 family competence protein [Clostridia bacterium]